MVELFRIGNCIDPNTETNPLISPHQLQRVEATSAPTRRKVLASLPEDTGSPMAHSLPAISSPPKESLTVSLMLCALRAKRF